MSNNSQIPFCQSLLTTPSDISESSAHDEIENSGVMGPFPHSSYHSQIAEHYVQSVLQQSKPQPCHDLNDSSDHMLWTIFDQQDHRMLLPSIETSPVSSDSVITLYPEFDGNRVSNCFCFDCCSRQDLISRQVLEPHSYDELSHFPGFSLPQVDVISCTPSEATFDRNLSESTSPGSISSPRFVSPSSTTRLSPEEADLEGPMNDESYAQLLFRALSSAPTHRMALQDIYTWFLRNTTKHQDSNTTGWQNSIRHNLSMNAVRFMQCSLCCQN